MVGAEGGSRTHKGVTHTILSRARLPVPPLRLNFAVCHCICPLRNFALTSL